MRIGIIAEFNPLHSGHKYLIDQAKNIIEKNKTNTDKIKLGVSLIFVNRQNNIFCQFKGGIYVLDK